MAAIEADYLVIGAGAAGMAFTDSLIAESACDVVMVDRRARPGGHWNDAYPFVRLHAPSTSYGVNSRTLGHDVIDTVGPNAGFYERAAGSEICGYYQRVLEDHLVGSGQVRFFGMCDHVGEGPDGHRLESRLGAEVTTVRVRRRVVDARYLEASVPATHTPSFVVDSDVRLVPVGQLEGVAEPPSGYTVLGAGKTAMDACCWLLDHGVDPDAIRWIRPRDAWMFDRALLQPLALLPTLMDGWSRALEAAAHAEGIDDLFRRLEACGHLVRLDRSVEPTMFRGAITSVAERDSLRQIERVVRLGRVLRIGADAIVLERGSIPTDRGQLHVDCTADGLTIRPPHPMFEPGRITLQSMTSGLVPFNSALIAYIEATRDDDAEKNRLCPPNANPTRAVDWMSMMAIGARARAAWAAEPDLAAWQERARLSFSCGLSQHLDDPRMQAALVRMGVYLESGAARLEELLAETRVAAD